MKKGNLKIQTLFLQAIVLLVGILTLAFLLLEPHVEGRNANATLFEIYFKDPFLAYAYVASIPFFIVLYQAFRILAHVRHGKALSQKVLQALKTIHYSAVAIIGFAIVGEVFIMLNESDDRAGGVFMGVLVIFFSTIIATSATMFTRIMHDTLDA